MNKPKVRKVYLKILAILACPFFLSGCMDADCKIPDYHVHKYVGKIRRGYKGYDEKHTIINYFNSEYLTPGYISTPFYNKTSLNISIKYSNGSTINIVKPADFVNGYFCFYYHRYC